MQQQNSNTRESKHFVMHENFIRMSAKLNDEQLIRFIRHIYQYINTGETHVDEADQRVSIIFEEWRIVYESDKEKYRQIVKMRSEAGKKGMKRRWEKSDAQEKQVDEQPGKQPDTETNNDFSVEASDNKTGEPCDNSEPCDNHCHAALENVDATASTTANVDGDAKEVKSGGRRRKKSATALSLNDRKQAFYISMQRYADYYNREMLNDFYQYWTELDKRQCYMRFELQKTWETGKRLSLWARKSFK